MGSEHQVGGTPRSAEETLDKTGRQTSQQAALTRREGGGEETGLTDAQRSAEWGQAGGEPGRAPVAAGGSSQGKSDQNDGRLGAEPAKVAGGLTRPEQDAAAREGEAR